jgi:hypothetical protein
MSPEEHGRMMELCQKIQTETDQQKFSELIYELSCLLERKRDELVQKGSVQKPSVQKPSASGQS